MQVTVLDEDLRAWRLARPEATVFPDSHLPPFACNARLSGIAPRLGDVELSGLPQRQPAPSMISSAEFVVGFRDDVLPVLDFFESSRSLAGNLPDSWFAAIDSGMIEQALARNDLEPAAALIRKYMERPLKTAQTWPERIGIFRQGWEQALGLSQRPQHGAGALGWLARIHNLLSPASLREPGPDSAERPISLTGTPGYMATGSTFGRLPGDGWRSAAAEIRAQGRPAGGPRRRSLRLKSS
jgi:hypothetical protein